VGKSYGSTESRPTVNGFGLIRMMLLNRMTDLPGSGAEEHLPWLNFWS
jgi:hypothetical protein